MALALILSADKYEIPDAATGEIQQLHQVWMSNDYRVATDKENGCKPVKTMVEPALFAELMKQPLPALFDVDMAMRPGKGNALAATVVAFKYVSTPKIFPTVAKAA